MYWHGCMEPLQLGASGDAMPSEPVAAGEAAARPRSMEYTNQIGRILNSRSISSGISKAQVILSMDELQNRASAVASYR